MSYEEIKKAVFYAHEKPDLLAQIIFGMLANKESDDNSTQEPDTPTGGD